MEASSDITRSSKTWDILGKAYSRNQCCFFSQIIILYVIILTSLVNLTLGTEPQSIWISLLGCCVGNLLPCPALKKVVQVEPNQQVHGRSISVSSTNKISTERFPGSSVGNDRFGDIGMTSGV